MVTQKKEKVKVNRNRTPTDSDRYFQYTYAGKMTVIKMGISTSPKIVLGLLLGLYLVLPSSAEQTLRRSSKSLATNEARSGALQKDLSATNEKELIPSITTKRYNQAGR